MSERRSDYITPVGAAKLQAELDRLWKVERPTVTREVQAAAQQGDRSENAEYIYGKRRLREIDRRLHYLSRRLEELTVVSEPVARDGRAYFGAWVTVEDEAGSQTRYRLVGPDETEAERGCISVDSPIGRALLGRRADDEVQVERPKGQIRYLILAVDYEEKPAR